MSDGWMVMLVGGFVGRWVAHWLLCPYNMDEGLLLFCWATWPYSFNTSNGFSPYWNIENSLFDYQHCNDNIFSRNCITWPWGNFSLKKITNLELFKEKYKRVLWRKHPRNCFQVYQELLFLKMSPDVYKWWWRVSSTSPAVFVFLVELSFLFFLK